MVPIPDRPGLQPAGLTNGLPPTVENNARTVGATTAIAATPSSASDIAARSRARPQDRESSSSDPTTSATSKRERQHHAEGLAPIGLDAVGTDHSELGTV